MTKEATAPVMRAPYHVNWNITYACPFNCQHCYSRVHSDDDELAVAEKLKVADNLVRSGVFSVNLGGGEPLMSEDIFPVIRKMSSHHVHVVLSTNGWQTASTLTLRLKDAGLGAVLLSIDNVNPEAHDRFRRQAGSFAACLRAARLYRLQSIPLSLSTVITSENFDSLDDLAKLATELGCVGLELKRLRLQGNAQEQKELLLSAQQEQALYHLVPSLRSRYPLRITLVYRVSPVSGIDEGCPCGKTTLCVLANGDLAPCVYNPYVIGNALRDDIGLIWRTSPYLKYLREQFICHGLKDFDEFLSAQ
jgi:MoaA/NifB/PqqE/SkfB family radical SAM enzyme